MCACRTEARLNGDGAAARFPECTRAHEASDHTLNAHGRRYGQSQAILRGSGADQRLDLGCSADAQAQAHRGSKSAHGGLKHDCGGTVLVHVMLGATRAHPCLHHDSGVSQLLEVMLTRGTACSFLQNDCCVLEQAMFCLDGFCTTPSLNRNGCCVKFPCCESFESLM